MLQALVTDVAGRDKQVTVMAKLRTLRNIGYSLGALFAAALLTLDTVWAFRAILMGNSASFLLAALLLSRLPVTRFVAPERTPLLRDARGLRDRAFSLVTGLNGVLVLHQSLLTVALPVWVVQHTEAPAVLVPVLFAVATVLVVTLQMRFARGDFSAARSVSMFRKASVLLVIACLLFCLSGFVDSGWATALLVAAVTFLTLGELSQSVSSWDLPVRFAPPGRQGEYLATFNLGVVMQAIVGSFIVATLLEMGSVAWLLIASLFATVGFLFGGAVAALQRSRVASRH
jgi:hypothetical protein